MFECDVGFGLPCSRYSGRPRTCTTLPKIPTFGVDLGFGLPRPRYQDVHVLLPGGPRNAGPPQHLPRGRFPRTSTFHNVLSTTEYPKTRFTYPPPIHNTYNPSKTTNKPSTEKGENETNKPATGRSREGLAECAERPAIRRPRGVSTGLRRIERMV